MYGEERKARHRALQDRCKDLDDKICDWNTVTEDEDEARHKEMQTVHIVSLFLDPETPYLTEAGTQLAEEFIARSEEWINRIIAEADDE